MLPLFRLLSLGIKRVGFPIVIPAEPISAYEMM